MSGVGGGALLLASGGLDSTVVAAWQRPAAALAIDYGHRPAEAEIGAARIVCKEMGVPLTTITVDATEVGAGLLAGTPSPSPERAPEFWPFRNQLLITLACAVALNSGLSEVLIGTVASDGARHVDGTLPFVERMSALCEMQEGGVAVSAPAIALTTEALIEVAGAPMSLLGWTHSCHTGNVACGACPGCWKRSAVFEALGHPR